MPPKKRGRKPTPKAKSKAVAEPSTPPSLDSQPTETPLSAPSPTSDPVLASPEPPIETLPIEPVETPVVNDDDAPNVNSESNAVVDEEAPVSIEEPAEPKKRVVKVVKKIVKKKVVRAKAQSVEQEGKVDEQSVEVTDLGVSVPAVQSETVEPVVDAPVDDPKVSIEKEDALPDEKEVPLEKKAAEGDKDEREGEENEVVGDVAELPEQDEGGGEGNAAARDVVMEDDKGEGEGKTGSGDVDVRDEEVQISERQKRRRTEIFVGGLDRDVTEEDLKNVFGKVGEIVEVRMMMDGQTGKNKGFAFVRYKEAGQAKQAVSELSKVEIRGKLCGAAALEGNDTIFLGNIDKKWKKEDLIKVLQDIGIEKIDTVTVIVDPHNTETNRGFAFLELESNRDAQVAFKKLSKKDVFGKSLNIKVAWAEPLNDPDEEEMQKVKSVYVESLPSSWDEVKVREFFGKFGDIERIVLARNIQSAKRKDFAFVNYTTREAALSCIESFDKEDIPDDILKAKLKVSLAKPNRKAKQNKGTPKLTNAGKVKTKSMQETKFGIGGNNGSSSRGGPNYSIGQRKFSNNDFIRPQAPWQLAQAGYGRGPAPDYSHGVVGGKRSYSALGEGAPYPDFRGFPRARFDNAYPVSNPSYGAAPQVPPGPSMPYYQRPATGYGSGPLHGAGRPNNPQRQGFPPYGNIYPRY